jgi:hypothetical protein
MCFDFIVLCLAEFKLYSDSTGCLCLINLIFNDVLLYFIIV